MALGVQAAINFTTGATRYYTSLQSVNQVGTFSVTSGGSNFSFSAYWVDSRTTATGQDGYMGTVSNFTHHTHDLKEKNTASTGTHTIWTTDEVMVSSSAMSLSFDTDALKHASEFVGVSGLASMSLIGEVPLAGNFSGEPGVPVAGPAATISGKALGTATGWWLELTSDGENGPGRWPQVKIAAESPASSSLDTIINYDASHGWRWSWLGTRSSRPGWAPCATAWPTSTWRRRPTC